MSPDPFVGDVGRVVAELSVAAAPAAAPAPAPAASSSAAASAGPLCLSLAELVSWGEAFGRSVRAPRVVALHGELGAGKTTLVQAIARGYGVTVPVTSPTFALVHEYAAGGALIYHLDLYRLRDARDLLHIGWSDIVESGALVLIEWPDRAGAALPEGAMHLSLAHVPNDHEHRLLTQR